MPSFRDLLADAKRVISEIDTEEAARRIATGGTVVLDVREPDEFEQGTLAGVVHIPRGHLEAQVETRIVDKSAPVIVYCAGGVRSAFAAKTLQELGYQNVVSMAGGFGRWKDEGRPWKTPTLLSAEQRNRYQRHLLLPEVGVEGQAKLLSSKVLMLGAGGLGSPAAMYLAAAGVGTIGIVDMDEVDASNLQRQILHNIDRIGDRGHRGVVVEVERSEERIDHRKQTPRLPKTAPVWVPGRSGPFHEKASATCLRCRPAQS